MRIYLLSLVVMIGVFFLHNFGMGGAYVRIWWLDIVSHSLVCFAVALCIGGLISSFTPHIRLKKTLIIVLTFTVGFMWEWLEVHYHITGHPLWSYEYYFDTVKDLIVDVVGASVAAYITIRRVRRSEGTMSESSFAVSAANIQNR